MGCAKQVSILGLTPDRASVNHMLMQPLIAPDKGDGVQKKKKKSTANVRMSIVPKATSMLGRSLSRRGGAQRQSGVIPGRTGSVAPGHTGALSPPSA